MPVDLNSVKRKYANLCKKYAKYVGLKFICKTMIIIACRNLNLNSPLC